ncbi:MAG: hypothetical protein GY754_46040 [bacterium]|nr:hypothetical protein [bacterium]
MEQKQTSPLSLVSLSLAICSLLLPVATFYFRISIISMIISFLFAVSAAVCAHISLKGIKNNEIIKGKKYAVTGLIIAYFVITLNLIIYVVIGALSAQR